MDVGRSWCEIWGDNWAGDDERPRCGWLRGKSNDESRERRWRILLTVSVVEGVDFGRSVRWLCVDES